MFDKESRMTDKDEQQLEAKLEQAYQNMMARLKTGLEMVVDHTREQTLPNLQQRIHMVVEKTIELEEISEEEGRKLGQYLQRDLEDAAQFLSRSNQELHDWLEFDLTLIEDSLLNLLKVTVNHTRDELLRLSLDAKLESEWHTGQVTGPGTLSCEQCGNTMQFHKPGRIPPCPSCKHIQFERNWDWDTIENANTK